MMTSKIQLSQPTFKLKTTIHTLAITSAMASAIAMLSSVSTFAYAEANDNKQTHPNNQTVSTAKHSTATNSTATNNTADQLIADAQAKGLAMHPTWLRLHYYEEDGHKKGEATGNQHYKSDIDNPDFFLSPEGRYNPQAELEAFIRTITKGDKNSNNAICQFPARTHWLTSQLGMSDYLAKANCPEFDKWINKLDPQRLSVVFAGEYPDTPVSAFAHTLMLIDSSASLADPTAIDKAHALNDTVGGNPDDGIFLYGIKSAIGNYPNDITIDPYPQKLAEYLQRDNRDVWTYALNLSGAEVQQIMRHVWESKDLQLPYYFTLDNCASEILRYIDIVRPEGNLLEQFKVAVIPADVVRLLADEGLITDRTYLPADNTLAQAKINNPQLELPDSSISANNTLNMTDLVPVNNDPLTAHPLQRGQVGLGQQGDTGYLSLGYQFGFNDWLARPDGYPDNFNMTTLSATVRVYENSDDSHSAGYDDVELEEATILQGRSFNPINTAYKGSTWGVDIGAKQVQDGSVNVHHGNNYANNQSHLVGNLTYEKGVSFAFGEATPNSGQLPPHLCYALGAGQVQVGKGLSNGYRVGASANLGCRYQINGKSRLIGEVQLPYWYHGDIHSDNALNQTKDSYWQPTLSIGAQYDIDRKQALRLEGSYQFQDHIEDKDDIQLSYVRYF